MTNLEMLEKMRGPEGFHQFGPSKVQRVFGLPYGKAIEWIEWLVGSGKAERIEDRPWEVRLL
jgi:hypothetical protein